VPDPGGLWLAIDTSTDQAGLALHDGAAVVAERQWVTRRRHTAELAPAVAEMLAAQGAAVGDLAGIAVAIGPGSYTGLRVSLALAKGMALAAAVPLVGIPTLDVVAAPWDVPGCGREVPLWAVLKAGRGRLAAALYPPPGDRAAAGGAAGATARLYRLEELVATAVPPAWAAGELDAATRGALATAGLTVLPPAAGLRRAGWLAELGRRRHAEVGPADLDAIAPAYLDPAARAQGPEGPA